MSCVPHRLNELCCRLSGGSAQIAKTLELAATSLKTVADASIATWDPDAPFVRSMSCSRCVVPFLRENFCFDNQFWDCWIDWVPEICRQLLRFQSHGSVSGSLNAASWNFNKTIQNDEEYEWFRFLLLFIIILTMVVLNTSWRSCTPCEIRAIQFCNKIILIHAHTCMSWAPCQRYLMQFYASLEQGGTKDELILRREGLISSRL